MRTLCAFIISSRDELPCMYGKHTQASGIYYSLQDFTER